MSCQHCLKLRSQGSQNEGYLQRGTIVPVVEVPEQNLFSDIERSGQLFEADSHVGIQDPLVLSTSVVVVGSGAGGSVVARELAAGGLDVVLVEAGRFWRPHLDFTQREETMNPALMYHSGARATKDQSLLISHGKGVGGSTVHNICLSVDPPSGIIDRWQDEFGYPYSHSELQPYVQRVHQHLGINQVHESQLNENNRILQRGSDRLGWHGFVPKHNRIGCLECGFCEVGCAFNRKQSALITYVPRFVRDGGRLVADTVIDKIVHDGSKVLGVQGTMRNSRGGSRKVEIRAKTVVASGGAVLSPVLLQNSGIPDPDNVVGKTFRTHPAVPVGGFFKQEVHGWKGIPQTYLVDEFADFLRTGYGGFMIFPIFGHPGQTGALVPGAGSVYTGRIQKYKHLAAVAPMIHDETMGEVYAGKDGQPVVDYFPNQADQQELIRGVQKSVELLLAAGAEEVFVPYLDQPLLVRDRKSMAQIASRGIPKNNIALNAVHPMGSIRFAADPKQGAIRFSGEHRYMKNRFVADASLFPTSIGTAPTVSIMTVSAMVAAYMLSEKSRIG